MIYEYVQGVPTHVFFAVLETNVRGHYSNIVRSTDSLRPHPTTNARHGALGGGGEACIHKGNRWLMQQRARKYQNDTPTSIWLVEPKHNIPKPSRSYYTYYLNKKSKKTSTSILDEPTQ